MALTSAAVVVIDRVALTSPTTMDSLNGEFVNIIPYTDALAIAKSYSGNPRMGVWILKLEQGTTPGPTARDIITKGQLYTA